jgi:exoribonuclease R
MKDIVLLQGRYYRLSKYKSTNFDKQSLRSILPEDFVEYDVQGNKINILKIIDRRPRITLGILNGKTLSLPLVSPHFLTHLQTHPYVAHPTSCLVKVDMGGISIIRTYGRIDQRGWDLQICQDVYLQSSSQRAMQPVIEQGEPLYDILQRVDQRELFTFNIDPSHSKDFDDAISVDIVNRKIYIHIVDIHHQLIDEPELEAKARSLGNTLYLSEGVYNVFPEFYSDHILSLVEGEDRLVITVEMELGDGYDIKGYKIYPAMICIKKRYCYEDVEQLLVQLDPTMMFLKGILEDGSWARSTFNIPQVRMQILHSKIEGLQQNFRTSSHEIVEALMVKTNQLISERLHTSDYHKILERYHETTLEIDLDTPPETIPETLLLLLRLRRARYSNTQSGHFALKLQSYTHFTSPIRRSFDVLVHKVLAGIRFQEDWLRNTIDYLNEREILIDKICQLYQQWKLMSYVEDRMEVDFQAEVLKVLPHGIQILVQPMLMTGFITLNGGSNFQTKRLIKVRSTSLDWKTFAVEWSIVE